MFVRGLYRQEVENGKGGIRYVGDDPDSIVNYCAESYVLSNGDVKGIASLYAAQIPAPTPKPRN